jgi:hypothetical protein
VILYGKFIFRPRAALQHSQILTKNIPHRLKPVLPNADY